MLKQNFEELKNKLKTMICDMNYSKEEIRKIVEIEINDLLNGIETNELYEYFNSELLEINAEEYFSEFQILTEGGVKFGGVLFVLLASLVMSSMQKELMAELTEKLN